jgi:peptidoglycan/xylan/chitin deacetylase (PgdA/CDA1 family)
MLQAVKRAALRAAKASGAFAGVARSRWRQERLLILCYHGVSIDDEHRWNPGLYLEYKVFRARMELLRQGEYCVLPLSEAVRRLEAGDLPGRSVALTFDDGAQDFYTQAYPVLREFGFPATLYLTTYYSRHQVPVFNTVCSYLLWKGIGKRFDADGLLPEGGGIEIRDEIARRGIMRRILLHLAENGTPAERKELLAQKLAAQLGVDYEQIRRRRMLHLMTPEQVAEVTRSGVDIQLHTHRHRSPRNRELFLREIEDNAREIRAMTGRDGPFEHFCYPSGDYSEMFFPWLHQSGVRWATTCETGLAERGSNPLLLPRLLDVSTLEPVEVEGWLTGFSGFLPTR